MSEQRERSRRGPSPYAPFYLGLDFRDRQRLYDRINRRVDQMVSDGLLEEAQRFLERDPDGTGAKKRWKILRAPLGAMQNGSSPGFAAMSEFIGCVGRIMIRPAHCMGRRVVWYRNRIGGG